MSSVRAWRSIPARQAYGLVLPLVAEREVEVADRERWEGVLGLCLHELTAQPWRIAAECVDRRQRDPPRGGLERADARAAGDAALCRGQLGLGERCALEQRVRVLDEHEARVGQANAAAGALEQGDARLALEYRELL